MKNLILILMVLSAFTGLSQKRLVKDLTKEVKQDDFASHIYFLASDEMRGRNTGTQENEIAARYIAEQFRVNGIKPVPGQRSYMQQVPLVKSVPPKKATITVGDSTFRLWDDIIFISTKDLVVTAEMVYVGFGFEEDLEGKDVEGKILVAKAGNGDPAKGSYKFSHEKFALAREKGAVALIELYRPSRIPWKLLINYLSGDRFSIDEGQEVEGFPSCWLVDGDGSRLEYFKAREGETITIFMTGSRRDKVEVPNVVGYVEGTDPDLKDEHIVVTAHFDHVGVKPIAEEDSIWNGARDNGIGTANMLETARYFAKNPPKRSLIFFACNAEEVGLLGSQWYAEHPLIPLEQTVLCFNTDNGGYNDTTKVTVIGYDRTNVTNFLTEGAEAFGLEAIDDPLPEENFYDRSDQVSFAAKGVPAVAFEPGFTSMDEEMTKYYHQPADEAESLNFSYLIKYSRTFIYTLNNIANSDKEIWWTEGDKYEPAGKALYGK